MDKKFIENVWLDSKDLVELQISSISDRPDDASVGMSISIESEDSKKKSFSEGDLSHVRVEFSIRVFDKDKMDIDDELLSETSPMDLDGYCFICKCTIQLVLRFKKAVTYKHSIVPQFNEGLLSLVYDDFRFIIEDTINRTSYGGLELPIDFRQITRQD